MFRKFSFLCLLAFLPLFLTAQNADDIVFHKPGYSIEKVLEVNKVINPFGSCFDDEGNLFTANWYSIVYQIGPDGSVSRLRYGGYGKQLFFPQFYDIKINPITKDIIVAGEGIYKFDKTTGEITEISADPGSCFHLTFDINGNLFASIATDSTGYIQKYNLESGSYTLAWTEYLSFHPEGIVFDSLENLYVCDLGGGRVIKLAPPYQGVAHETIVEGLGYVYDISIDGSNNLFILIEEAGSPLSVVKLPPGGLSPELIRSDLPGGFYITVYNGEIYFSAMYHCAIKKIDMNGNMTDFTEDHEVKWLYTMTSDLEGNPIVYCSDIGKIFRLNSASQVETLAADMGIIRAIDTNAAGDLYCYTFRRENIPTYRLFKIPMDGSPPELVFDFNRENTYGMKFYPGESDRLALLMVNHSEIWEFNLISKDSIVIAENVTSRLGIDLDTEHNLYVGEGLSEGIKKAPYPTVPPIDMSLVPLHIIMNIAEPETFRYFEVFPNGDVYIPVANPSGEIHIGPSGGGNAELLASGFSFPNAAQLGRYGRLWVADAGNGLFKIINQENITTQNVKNCEYLIEEIQESSIGSGATMSIQDLSSWIKKSLIAELNGAKKSLELEAVRAAIVWLIAFKIEVEVLKGRKIPEDLADRWITIAKGMIKALREVL